MPIIKTFEDETYLEFARGGFDDWCVYYVDEENNKRMPPTDTFYFSRLADLGNIHGHDKIYKDFISFYEKTDHTINQDILDLIGKVSQTYKDDWLVLDKLFTTIYAGMIAEENKAYAILKKRIKRLGMYQVLIEQQAPDFAANFSRGKKWRELDRLCKERGF